jgi:4-alpha-glucanotransferase
VTDTPLRRLADALGILAEYSDQGGVPRHTSDDTRRGIIAAMGIDATTDARATEALRAMQSWENDRLIEPVVVVDHADPRAGRLTLNGGTHAASSRWELRITDEDGQSTVTSGDSLGEGGLELALPSIAGPGYFDLELRMTAGRHEQQAFQRRIVTPARCTTPDDVLGGRRVFGLIANLYTLRSERNWGVGDLTDLATLATWAASVDAEFVGINPLHALLNRGAEISPYGPLSRLFRNPLYIDPALVPELSAAPALAERLRSDEIMERLESLRADRAVQYEQVMAVKGIALDALHDCFVRRDASGADDRATAYRAYVDAHEPELTRYATYMALAEHHAAQRHTPGAHDWRSWDAPLRDHRSSAVARFQTEHHARIDFHRWVQFELDRQLGGVAARAKSAGLAIGLYQDLAIGSSPAGADTWSHPELFVTGASIGAPPDPYAAHGQNWGLPPIDPRALREDGYRYFTEVIRSALRHSGALRIDHVMGLFRLFWIPDGMSGEMGAYVRYPAHDLLGILALESVRHGAIIIGEDLGTVPPEVGPALAQRGILSSKVMFFERSAHGFTAPASYPRNALATVNTHDMTPLAGYESMRDIQLRTAAGALSADERKADIESRTDDKRQLDVLLRGVATETGHRDRYIGIDLRAAMHEAVCRTPCVLAGISLDDLSGETEPVNIPGLSQSVHPSWTRKMRHTLADLMHSDDVRRMLPCAERARSS